MSLIAIAATCALVVLAQGLHGRARRGNAVL